MKKLLVVVAVLVFCASSVMAETVTFTAAQIKAAMPSLSNVTYQWGLWAVRAMPIVGGNGLFTITGGNTSQVGWGASAPNGAFGAAPYTSANSAWFWDASGAEVLGDPANPLYMIVDKPASSFTSYFGNTVTAVNDSSTFNFDFALDAGATWTGQWQFVVDGSEYTAGTDAAPGIWVADFFGGYGTGGGITGNMGAGFAGPTVPEPMSIFLGIMGLGSVAGFKRLRRK